jgi:hypothetical protein
VGKYGAAWNFKLVELGQAKRADLVRKQEAYFRARRLWASYVSSKTVSIALNLPCL